MGRPRQSLDGELVQAVRSLATAEDEQHGAARPARPKRCAPRPAVDRPRAPPGSAGRHAVLPPSRPAIGKREEDALRERRGEPVGETEMGVGLGQRRRDPSSPRGQHHRPGDVAAGAEHDVRLPAAQDRAAGAAAPRPRAAPARALAERRPAREARRSRTCRTRSRAQGRAAPRRDPATRRTSPARPARAALLRPPAPARRGRPSLRPRSGTAALARPPLPGDVKEDPDPGERDDEARAAVGDERERDAGQRREPEDGGEVDRRLRRRRAP